MADHMPLTAGPATGAALPANVPPQPAAPAGTAASWRTFLLMLQHDGDAQAPQQPSDAVEDFLATSEAVPDSAPNRDPEKGTQAESLADPKPKGPQLPSTADQISSDPQDAPEARSERPIAAQSIESHSPSVLPSTLQKPVAPSPEVSQDVGTPDLASSIPPPAASQERTTDPETTVSTHPPLNNIPEAGEKQGSSPLASMHQMTGQRLPSVLADPSVPSAKPRQAGVRSIDGSQPAHPPSSAMASPTKTPQLFPLPNQSDGPIRTPKPLNGATNGPLVETGTGVQSASGTAATASTEADAPYTPPPTAAALQNAPPVQAPHPVKGGSSKAVASMGDAGPHQPPDTVQPDSPERLEATPMRPWSSPSAGGAKPPPEVPPALPISAAPSSLNPHAQSATPVDLQMPLTSDADTFGERLAMASPATPLTPAPPLVGPQAPAQAQTQVQAQAVWSQLQPQLPKSGGAVEITLSPKELGTVKLIAHPGEAGLTLAIVAERPETQELMRKHLDLLQAELRKAGFSALDFGADPNGSASGSMADKASNGAQRSPEPPEDRPAASDLDIDHSLSASATQAIDGRLDLRL